MDSNESNKKYQLAGNLYREKKHAEALELMDEIAEMYPVDQDLMAARAECLFMAGRKEEAWQVCDRLEILFDDKRGAQLKARMGIGAQGPVMEGEKAWGGHWRLMLGVIAGLLAFVGGTTAVVKNTNHAVLVDNSPVWVWMGGSSLANQPGFSVAFGVDDIVNTPGQRLLASSWTDESGAFWLFGGMSQLSFDQAAANNNYRNDLWKRDPNNGNWTWMKGSNIENQPGVYGIRGVESPANTPSSRTFASSWLDSGGHLWLFGGGELYGTNYLNDMWRFDTHTGNWAWMKGSNTINQPGVYGAVGIDAPDNIPGARFGAFTWTDNSGDMWLYGGHGYDSIGTQAILNDMWRYDHETGNWMWVGGDSIAPPLDATGVYASQGVEDEKCNPGPRFCGRTWVDTSGRFWLFGGSDADASGRFLAKNDLWRYNPKTGEWAWMKGSNTTDQEGVYGVLGIENPNNTPSARANSVSWADKNGNLWLFGGSSDNGVAYMNDLWRYSTNTNNWTWMKGSSDLNSPGVYGVIGIANSRSNPGGRANVTYWMDRFGALWIWGGSGMDGKSNSGVLNDLWKLSY